MISRFPWFSTSPSKKPNRRPAVRLEALEDRSVPAALMASGAQTGVATWGILPTYPIDSTANSFYTSVNIVTKDINNQPIDFNKDGYADLAQSGKIGEFIGYGTKSSPLVGFDRGGFGRVAFGGTSGLTYSTTGVVSHGVTYQFTGESCAIADLNDDGFQDILSIHSTSTTGAGAETIRYLWDQVNQSFTKVVGGPLDAWAHRYGQLNLGDVNSDNIPDLITQNYSTTPVTDPTLGDVLPMIGFQVYLGKSDAVAGRWIGDFESTAYATINLKQASNEWGLGIRNPGAIIVNTASTTPVINTVLADLNNDGKLDLAIPEADGISVFPNPGNGKFTQPSALFFQSAGAARGLNLVTGDFNNDGKADLATSPNIVSLQLMGELSPTLQQWQASTAPLSVFLNTTPTGGATNFSLTPVSGFATGGATYNGTIALADFTGDSNLDIAVANGSNESTFYGLLEGDGKGGFASLKQFTGYSNATDGYDANFHRALVYLNSADFNNDGQIDIASTALNIGPDGSPNTGQSNPAVGITALSFNNTYATPVINPAAIAAATVGIPYSQQLQVIGGDPSKLFAFALNSKSISLPTGLTLSPTGLISGTPTQPGPFQLFIDVSQPNGPKGTSPVDLQVFQAPVNQLVINPNSLPDATVGQYYTQTLTASFATGPVNYVVSAGSLPAGLSLNTNGFLSGIVSATGANTFTVTGTDSVGASGSRQYTLNTIITPVPPGPVGATVQMFPGGDLQTNLPQVGGETIQLGGDFLVTRDVNNNIIDFNNDGNPDVINFGFELVGGTNQYLVASDILSPLLADANGEFRYTSVGINPFIGGVRMAGVVDYNDDGYQDILTISALSNTVLKHYKNNQDGTFSLESALSQELSPGRTAISVYSTPLAMADFNKDGAPDILIPDLTQVGKYSLLNGSLQGGKWDGNFDLASEQLLNPGTITSNVGTSGSLLSVLPVAADLNGDGNLDITMQGPTGIRIFVNDGKGIFPSSNDVNSQYKSYGLNLAAGDFNNDGKIDLASSPGVTQSKGVPPGIGPISIYINTPSGQGIPTFAPAVGYLPALAHSVLAVADMNLDGNLDLVASGTVSNIYQVLEGDGAGAFGNIQTFSGFSANGFVQGGIGIADWNHDGQADVAMGVRAPDYSVVTPNVRYNQSVGVSINGTFVSPGVSPATLPSAVNGVPYSFQLTFTGGDKTKAYAVTVDPVSNPLPAGLTVSPSGLISGTPTQTGPFQVNFLVSQPNGLVGSNLVYLQVNNNQPAVVTISPATLSNGFVNTAYSQQLTQTGGTGSIAWAISSGSLPSGLSLSPNGLISGQPTATTVANFTVSATDSLGNIGYRAYTLTVSTSSLPPLGTPNIVAASATGLGTVTIFNANGTPRSTFHPYGTYYLGGITVAQGDVDGDGTNDLITGTTFGAEPHVKVFNGKTLAVMQSFYAYTQSFTGGVSVAAGDVNGDGNADIITGAGPGGGPHVQVFNGTNAQLIDSFFAYNQNFKGGVHVAAGDLNNDGKDDIITGAGASGGSHVKAFSGADQSTLLSFMAYNAQFTGGVNVATGDFNGDGNDDIITGPGIGGGPNVKVFNGQSGSQLASFFAFGQTSTGGVNVSAADVNNDGKDDIIASLASGGSQVSTFDAVTLALIESFEAFTQPVGVNISGK